MPDSCRKPWHTVGSAKGRIIGDCKADGATDFYIHNANCTVAKVFRSGDADLIVRAVNCHDDLLESLATLLGACEADCMDDKSNVYRSAMADANAAISKATGR